LYATEKSGTEIEEIGDRQIIAYIFSNGVEIVPARCFMGVEDSSGASRTIQPFGTTNGLSLRNLETPESMKRPTLGWVTPLPVSSHPSIYASPVSRV
jgi:hypothetical protein